MTAFPVHLPVAVSFGTDALHTLGDRTALPPGDRALILARDTGACFADGSLNLVQGHLSEAGVGSMVMDAVPAPADMATAELAARRAMDSECSFIAALGGPGTSATAKMAAHLADVPLVAVCAQPPCGGELDQWSPLVRADLPGRSHPNPEGVFPSLAIVDPALALPKGERPAVMSGLGALARAVDAYCSTAATPFSDLLALEAVALAASSLPRASAPDTAARLAWAGVLAGLALGLSSPGPAWALAAALKARHPAIDMNAAMASLAPAYVARCPLPDHRLDSLGAALGSDAPPARALAELVHQALLGYESILAVPVDADPDQTARNAVEDFNAFFASAPGRPDIPLARHMILDAQQENDAS